MSTELIRPEKSSVPSIELLAAIPEEDIWLQGQRSHHTRRAYKEDVLHFMRMLSITKRDELRQVDRAAVIVWIRHMEEKKEKPRTIRRRLAALSSLYTHLVDHRAADKNPVREIKRPRVNRKRGVTAAFDAKQARKILDAPSDKTLQGLRDRAILSILFQAGPRRAEVASMKVRDFHTNMGYAAIRFIRKGGEEHSLSLNPQTAQRIDLYLNAAGHRAYGEGPLFRAVKKNHWKNPDARRHLSADIIDRIVRKYAKRALGIGRGFSAHSCRATFATTSLTNGSSLEDVQEALGHADATTTKLYDKRGFNPEKSAAFFANY
jgi:site-specific recombinase XerD